MEQQQFKLVCNNNKNESIKAKTQGIEEKVHSLIQGKIYYKHWQKPQEREKKNYKIQSYI